MSASAMQGSHNYMPTSYLTLKAHNVPVHLEQLNASEAFLNGHK